MIRPSDGDVKPGGPLGAFREEQAMSQHRVSPSPFLSSSSHTPQHNYTTHTVTQPQLSPVHYTDIRPTLNAIYPPCVEPEAQNSAVGWHWNIQHI